MLNVLHAHDFNPAGILQQAGLRATRMAGDFDAVVDLGDFLSQVGLPFSQHVQGRWVATSITYDVLPLCIMAVCSI